MHFRNQTNLTPFARVASLVLVILLVSSPAFCGLQNLIVDGDFDNLGYTPTSTFTLDTIYNSGNPNAVMHSINGWYLVNPTSSTNLECVVIQTDIQNCQHAGLAFGAWPGLSKNGGNVLAVDGDPTFRVAVAQDITGLVINQQYTLTFEQASTSQYITNSVATTEQWQVTFGNPATNGDVQTSTLMHTAANSDTPWTTQTMTFTAHAVTQTLSFLALGTPTGYPPVVLMDGASLLVATPEPDTFALVGFCLIALPMLSRKFGKKS